MYKTAQSMLEGSLVTGRSGSEAHGAHSCYDSGQMLLHIRRHPLMVDRASSSSSEGQG